MITNYITVGYAHRQVFFCTDSPESVRAAYTDAAAMRAHRTYDRTIGIYRASPHAPGVREIGYAPREVPS